MIGWMILLLLGQLACAVVGLVLLGRRVCPALRVLRTSEPGLIADVWAPLALVIPMLCQAGRVEASVAGVGWAPVGGAVGVGLVGIGVSMWAMARFVAPGRGGRPAGQRLSAALGLAGLILLLLGAAHDLTIWTGQCTFAIAAVLLWMNTPRHVPAPPGPDGRAGDYGRWLAFVVLLAIGQGVCALMVPAKGAEVSTTLTVAYAIVGVTIAAQAGGPAWGMRIAGWAAALGTLLGIGTLSLLHLAPQSIAVAMAVGTRERVNVDVQVAYGFGTYAVEATLLLVLAVAVAARPAAIPLRAIGLSLVIGGGVLVAYRLLGQ